jgi:hypothetical protein
MVDNQHVRLRPSDTKVHKRTISFSDSHSRRGGIIRSDGGMTAAAAIAASTPQPSSSSSNYNAAMSSLSINPSLTSSGGGSGITFASARSTIGPTGERVESGILARRPRRNDISSVPSPLSPPMITVAGARRDRFSMAAAAAAVAASPSIDMTGARSPGTLHTRSISAEFIQNTFRGQAACCSCQCNELHPTLYASCSCRCSRLRRRDIRHINNGSTSTSSNDNQHINDDDIMLYPECKCSQHLTRVQATDGKLLHHMPVFMSCR